MLQLSNRRTGIRRRRRGCRWAQRYSRAQSHPLRNASRAPSGAAEQHTHLPFRHLMSATHKFLYPPPQGAFEKLISSARKRFEDAVASNPTSADGTHSPVSALLSF